jgi:hypothetical protein
MRTELTPENLEAFRERFDTFHDAVIHNIQYEIFSSRRRSEMPEVVTITVGMRDWQIESEEKWINLIFYVEAIEEMVLRKSRNYENAIIFSMSIEFFDGEVYLDFFRGPYKPTGPADYKKGSTGTQLLVIGKRCFWSVEPYQARE